MSGYLTIKVNKDGEIDRVIFIKHDYITDFYVKYYEDKVFIKIFCKDGEFSFSSLKEDENEIELIVNRLEHISCDSVFWKADYHDKQIMRPFQKKEGAPFDINKLAEELGIKDELDALTEK